MIDRDEKYDIAHFEFVMRGVQRAMEQFKDRRDCDQPEPTRARRREDHGDLSPKLVQQDGKLTGLKAYSAARPPHSEGLAISIASYLAHETNCVNINLLHLTSRKAVEAALKMAKAFPHVNFRREVTVGHLLLDYDAPTGVLAKVNPPIRSRADVEYLWQTLLDGKLDWVCSDHACCRHEMKVDAKQPGEVFKGKSGFGGTEYLLSGCGERRPQARPVLEPDRRADVVERRPAFRPQGQGRHRRRLRRRPGVVRSGQVVRRAGGRVRVDPGLHAVRGHGAHGPGHQHVPAGRPDLRQGTASASRGQVLAPSRTSVGLATRRPGEPGRDAAVPPPVRQRHRIHAPRWLTTQEENDHDDQSG